MRGCDHQSIPLLLLKLRGRDRERERQRESRIEVGGTTEHFSVEELQAEEEIVKKKRQKQSKRETQILQQRVREVRRVKDSQTLTGVQLSVIPVEATVPILSCQGNIQGHTARHVVQYAHKAHHTNQTLTHTWLHNFIRAQKHTSNILTVLPQKQAFKHICHHAHVSLGAQPLEDLGNNWCQRWLAPAATTPKVQVCARG